MTILYSILSIYILIGMFIAGIYVADPANKNDSIFEKITGFILMTILWLPAFMLPIYPADVIATSENKDDVPTFDKIEEGTSKLTVDEDTVV